MRGNHGGVGGITLYGDGNAVICRSSIVNNGNSSGLWAGGILVYNNTGKTVIEDSTISSNTGGRAGGILTSFFSAGELEIIRTKISGNTGQDAGGIDIETPTSVLIESSMISNNVGSGNHPSDAGGVSNVNGTTDLKILRSTINGNMAVPLDFGYEAAGGLLGSAMIDDSTISGNSVMASHLSLFHGFFGLAAGGVLGLAGPETTIDHSTIAFNKVVDIPVGSFEVSGGVTSETETVLFNGRTFTFDALASVHDTIIAKNQASLGDPDVAGAFQSQGHNLIGVLGSGASGFVASDLHGTPSAPLDPRLLPLGWYGGPTKTHALAEDSPAIDAGDNTNAPATDQRGRKRIVGGIIDIGSYERGTGAHDSHERDDAGALLDAVWADCDHLMNWQRW